MYFVLLIPFPVKLAIIFSGIYLWVGMLTGVWKYAQMHHSDSGRAHYYVDIAHRSSLLYAPATLILAVLAYFSFWPAWLNLILICINLIFFSFAILSYVLHGYLKDTNNQFKRPNQIGGWQLPDWVLKTVMLFLIVGELLATGALLIGTGLYFVMS